MEIHLHRILLIIFSLLLIPVTQICCTNDSTVCFGVDGPSCTTHRLSCPSSLVIQIINTSYGYRQGCNNTVGIPSCDNTSCCNEGPGDCSILFPSEEYKQVLGNCSRKEACKLRGFRSYNQTHIVCNEAVSAYSKIQYDCVTNGSSVATTSTSSYVSDDAGTSDAGSIVGGLFGAIIIIVLIVLVVLFLYKRRKRALSQPSTNKETTFQTKTHYPTIGGPNASTIKTKNTSGYDEIDLNCKPDSTDRISNMRNHDHSVHEDNYNYIGEKSTRPTQHETDYNHITGVLGTANVEDDYNHIGGNDNKKVVTNDNYHHIGNNLSTSPRQLDTDYNHIAGVLGSSTVEDDYNHIGNNDNKKVIIDDNYHHIRSGDIQVEGDYNHIGSDELTSGSNDHYNHIPDDNNHARESDNHNLYGDEAPYNFATC